MVPSHKAGFFLHTQEQEILLKLTSSFLRDFSRLELPNVQVCDTTTADSSALAGYIINI